jgi:hypothetical protein
VVDADALRDEFLDRGVVRVNGAFPVDAADRIRDVVWRYAERKTGVGAGDRASWPVDGRLPLSWKGLKRNRAFDVVIGNPAVSGALDTLFGTGRWRHPKPGAQVLVHLPTRGRWALPDGWHMDCGFEQPTWPVFAVKLFAFFGDVGPRGGGTMLLPGTHRLVDRYRTTVDPPPGGGRVNWQRFLRAHPPLGDLLRGESRDDLGRSMVGARYAIDGVPVDVVELTGAPGDVVVTHLHVFHTVSPNTSDVPRQMLGKAVFAA